MKRHIWIAILTLQFVTALAISAFAQEPTRESVGRKKQRRGEIEIAIIADQQKVINLSGQIEAAKAEIAAKAKSIAKAEEELELLKEEIAAEEEDVAFLESPAGTVLDVTSPTTFLINYKGITRLISLHGITLNAGIEGRVQSTFKKAYKKKPIYIRCANEDCSYAYLYTDRKAPSLNAQLVRTGLASTTSTAKYEIAAPRPRRTDVAADTSNASDGSTASSGSSSSSSSGGTVHVRGYTRKDGTYVRPHTRSAPSRSGSSRSGGRRP